MRAVDDITITQCMKCNNRTPGFGVSDEYGPLWVCKAFPAGIPREIAANVIDHTQPIRGRMAYNSNQSIYCIKSTTN